MVHYSLKIKLRKQQTFYLVFFHKCFVLLHATKIDITLSIKDKIAKKQMFYLVFFHKCFVLLLQRKIETTKRYLQFQVGTSFRYTRYRKLANKHIKLSIIS